MIGDESLCRGLKHLAPSIGNRCSEEERIRREGQLAKSSAWMDAALKESIGAALDTGWILDCQVYSGASADGLVGAVSAETKLHVFCRYECAEVSGLLWPSCSSEQPSLRHLLRIDVPIL